MRNTYSAHTRGSSPQFGSLFPDRHCSKAMDNLTRALMAGSSLGQISKAAMGRFWRALKEPYERVVARLDRKRLGPTFTSRPQYHPPRRFRSSLATIRQTGPKPFHRLCSQPFRGKTGLR